MLSGDHALHLVHINNLICGLISLKTSEQNKHICSEGKQREGGSPSLVLILDTFENSWLYF